MNSSPAFDPPGDAASGRYAVALLGDTHYDAEPESVYHSHYDESNRWAKIQHEEFRRNGEMWRGRCRDLVAAAGALARAEPTRFVLQIGDLVQGDCDDPATHARMLEDCIRLLRAPFPADLPFLSVLGNHDVRGKGAREAYLAFARDFFTRQAGVEASYPSFSLRLEGDLWLFCDFENCPLDRLSDEIDGARDARRVFLVTHGPFTADESPFWRWRLGGRSEEGRARLYETLSRRRAVVLSGHTHTTAFYRHENPFGGFCEFTINSVWAAPELATAVPEADRPEAYGTVRRGEIREEDLGAFDRDHGFFRPFLREYFYGRAAGHARLHVSADAVSLSFHPGAAREPGRVFRLAGPAVR